MTLGVHLNISNINYPNHPYWDLLTSFAHIQTIPVGICSLRSHIPYLRGPSSKILAKAVQTSSELTFMQLPPYKSKHLTVAMHKKSIASAMLLLNFRDSVGIRTQDPQLRRLLLYPAELPNRSALSFKRLANIVKFILLAKFIIFAFEK